MSTRQCHGRPDLSAAARSHDFSDHATRALEIADGLAGAGGTRSCRAMAPVYSSMEVRPPT
jgi:hypothetical protein